ncbi:hypothetical protein ABE957_15235 [Halomonas sp. CS7]|uniref:EpsG family protein n=1 Tax=Halomonas pelophila TaxID=3151122 RepID=A0ABV1N8F1_9GAMM
MNVRHLGSAHVARSMGKRDIGFSLLISPFFPPVLLYAAWKCKNFGHRHWLLTIFVVWYAVSLPIAYDPTGEGPDGVRHLLSVYTFYSDMTFHQFMSDSFEIVQFKGAPGSNDLFKHIVAYFAGSVIGVPELFFPMVGIFYGYFFTGSMLIIFRNIYHRKLPWVIIFLCLCFFLTRNIESLQAVRNPTAGWVLIYGILRFQETKKLRYIALMATTPLIHFSFLLLALPAFVFLAIGNKPMVYAIMFTLSSQISLVAPDVAVDFISQVDIGQQKVIDRSDRDQADLDDRAKVIEQQMQGGTRLWRAYMVAGYQKIALDVLIYGLIFSGAYFSMNIFAKNILSNGLMMLIASNLLWFLGIAAGRFWGLGFLLVMAGFILWRLGTEFSIEKIIWDKAYILASYISALLFFPYVIYYISKLMDFMTIFVFAFPWLTSIYPDIFSIKEMLRFVLPI